MELLVPISLTTVLHSGLFPNRSVGKFSRKEGQYNKSPFYRGNGGTKKPTARRSTVRGLLNVFGDPH